MLQLAIFDAPNGSLIADVSGQARNVIASTNQHGFAALTADIDMALAAAFTLYDRPGLPHVVLGDGANVIFEGRLEDVAITDEGATIQALGYWRALSDAPYTALWSDTSVADWRPVLPTEFSGALPDRWQIDTNERLYLAPQKNEVFGTTTAIGGLTYEAPDDGERTITAFACTYELVAPVGWRAGIYTYARDWSGVASIQVLDGNGGTQTGTWNFTFTGANRLDVHLRYTGTDTEYTGETGALYFKLTSIRVKSTTAATVTADAIAGALITYVNGINSTQINLTQALLASPGLDMTDEVYEDVLPANILTYLTRLGDDNSPPRQWEVGIWENRVLHLRVWGSAGRAWFVNVGSLDITRSLDALMNASYGVYQDIGGFTRRTALAMDPPSIARYGVTRRGAVAAQTTSDANAMQVRDAYLADHKMPAPRASITVQALYDAAGGRWPLWLARSGDTITIRNLPPIVSLDVDRIRTFGITETSYNCDTDTLTVTPELPLPSLEVLQARGGRMSTTANTTTSESYDILIADSGDELVSEVEINAAYKVS